MAEYGTSQATEAKAAAFVLKKGDTVPEQLKLLYRMDRDHAEDWRNETAESFDFVAGRQYTDKELEALKVKKRPSPIFNRINVIIKAVTGYEIGNRREVRYIPRELGDAQANELLTSAGEWFNDKASGDYVRSAVFRDTVIGGMGWSETRIDYDASKDGEPSEDHIDWAEMAWDCDSRQPNLSDATRIWRARRIPLSVAQEMFPGFTDQELNARWSDINGPSDLKRDDSANIAGNSNSTKYVTLVQCQYITREPYYVAEDPTTGQQSEFSKEEFETASKRMKQLIGTEMRGVRFNKKVIKQAFLGSIVLSYGPAPCPTEFSLQCVTGEFDRATGTWFGLVRGMKDPQRWANKWLATLMFIMNSNAKGGLLAEKGALANPREAMEKWGDPDSVTVVNDGRMAGIQQKEQAPFPVGFQTMTEYAISSIRDVSGVSQELLGLTATDQPASLEAQRRMAGMNILQWAFDGMTLYSRRQGTVVLYYLQHDLSDGRMIRIVGKDNEKYVPLIKQADLEYDIIVDDAPTSPNQKEQVWAIIQSFLPLVGKVIPPEFLLKALKYSPLPTSVVAQLDELAAQGPTPEQQQAQQLTIAHQTAQIADLQAKATLNQAKAQTEGQPTQRPSNELSKDTVFNGLIKLLAAEISAKQKGDETNIEAELEASLGMTNIVSDHALQAKEHAHQADQQQANAAATMTQTAQQAAMQPEPQGQ